MPNDCFENENMSREYRAQKLGTTRWVVAPRLTPALREKGYEKAISAKNYDDLQAAYEIETFGAPVASLKRNAPALLSALKTLLAEGSQHDEGTFVINNLEAVKAAHAAVYRAEGL